ncbi:MAG: hypothetical protein JNJ73_00010 [Hyphomonadaceae bacterium]|nr:hypothetical protein [Hyphomonadaceae bacterium]
MRALIFAIALLAPTSAFAASTPGRVAFDVFRNGQPFGTHVVEVTARDGRLEVASRAELRAGLGPLTVFHYEHVCREAWTGGALVALECSTLRNGKRVRVEARRENGVLKVANGAGEVQFPASALPTSWWTKPPTSLTSMIDTETGLRRPLRVVDLGRGPIDVGGRRIEAQRIRIEGALAADLWYDDAGRWIGCAFTARGQRIEYRLVSPLQSAPR